MTQTASYPCTRCGKERVISKTWKEAVKTFTGVSMVLHTETICPDPTCQKVVDEQLAVQRAKYAFHQARKFRKGGNKDGAKDAKEADKISKD
jgi:hypothetical protein